MTVVWYGQIVKAKDAPTLYPIHRPKLHSVAGAASIGLFESIGHRVVSGWDVARIWHPRHP